MVFDIICYRLKGHLNYQCEIVAAGKSIEDAVDNWQNVVDSHRVTGFASQEAANDYVREKYENDSN